ncbi:bromodomain-containing protein [Reticulomyxa filosa]|uniref:Bromodomain-containing protein n=1 Tax=Reticulomyxa filosa TaxID=46433 RepID=X6M8H7_RETFI|nr:bromodomain-containing protein [Reticulomyxa filosa]|eukprot:ETO10293.1 bromodomain-containing protein [Reticulomyxa filosa]
MYTYLFIYLIYVQTKCTKKKKRIWETNGMQTLVTGIQSDEYVRVLSNELVIEMIKCISSWTKSDILNRVFAQCMMQDVDCLANWQDPFYDTTTLKVEIPGWIDDGQDWIEKPSHSPLGKQIRADYHNRYKAQEFIHETKTPIWYFFLNDFAMSELSFLYIYIYVRYREGSNNLWYGLMTLSALKCRLCHVLTFMYQKLIANVSVMEQTTSILNVYTVQLFQVDNMICDVMRTHNLLGIAIHAFMHTLCDTAVMYTKMPATNQNDFEFIDTSQKAIFDNSNNLAFDTLKYDLSYMFDRKNTAHFLYSQRPDLLKKWCQTLCLLQNVYEIYREIGHFEALAESDWRKVVLRNSKIMKLSDQLIASTHRLLSSPTTSSELKERIRKVLLVIIAEAFPMIDWKPWKPLQTKPWVIQTCTVPSTTKSRATPSTLSQLQVGVQDRLFLPSTTKTTSIHPDTIDAYGDDLYAHSSDDQDENDMSIPDVTDQVDQKEPQQQQSQSQSQQYLTQELQQSQAIKTEDEDKKEKKEEEKGLSPIMVLNTFEGGQEEEEEEEEKEKEVLEMDFFRVDRDRLSLILPLSRFIVYLGAIYCQTFRVSFLTMGKRNRATYFFFFFFKFKYDL